MDNTTGLIVNGVERQARVDPDKSLLFVLRDDFDLTGPKYGCGEGQCGACTVLIDGEAARSCITPLSAVAGKHVTTIEGLGSPGNLHPLQRAFIDAGAMQCGYCTAGMIMSAAGLFAKVPHPSEAQILKHMEGNVCRCATYPRILQAIQSAASAHGGQER